MIFNYKRVSTVAQNTERQLVDVPCDREYEDKLSAKDTNRPQLQAMLDNLREGDVVNVHSLDRLARSVTDLLDLVKTIEDKGATINFKKENLTFGGGENANPFQRLMLTMLGAIAEFERNLLLERQREGIAIGKRKGNYKGSSKRLTRTEIENLKYLRMSGEKIDDIAKRFNISRRSVYNYLD